MLVMEKITIKQKAVIFIVVAVMYNLNFIMYINNLEKSILGIPSLVLIIAMLMLGINVVKETKDNKKSRTSMIMGIVAIFMSSYILLDSLLNEHRENNIVIIKYGELVSLYLIAFCVVTIKQYNENMKLIAAGANIKNRCPNCGTENVDNYEDCIKCGMQRKK